MGAVYELICPYIIVFWFYREVGRVGKLSWVEGIH